MGYSRKIKGTDKVESMKYPEEGMTMVIVSANSRAELGKESDFFEMTKEKRRRIFGGFLFCFGISENI